MLVREPENLETGNGVEVWIAMHEDETCRIRDSGDESIGQGQATGCGVAQTDRRKRGFGVPGKQGGQAGGVLKEDIFPHFLFGDQFAQFCIELDLGWGGKGHDARPLGKQVFHIIRAGFIQEMGEDG